MKWRAQDGCNKNGGGKKDRGGTDRAFAGEKHALGAAAAHAHEAAEAEGVDVRLQTKLCGLEVDLQKSDGCVGESMGKDGC